MDETIPIFKPGHHFDLNYTPVKFCDCVLHGCVVITMKRSLWTDRRTEIQTHSTLPLSNHPTLPYRLKQGLPQLHLPVLQNENWTNDEGVVRPVWMAFVFITKKQNRTDFQGCLCDLRSRLYLNVTSSLYPCCLLLLQSVLFYQIVRISSVSSASHSPTVYC